MIERIRQKIEIVVEDRAGAQFAACEGADSIELCLSLDEGGLTPPLDVMASVIDTVRKTNRTTECHILILNRPSGFYPSVDDVIALRRGIKEARDCGADGVVFGALTDSDLLDLAVLKELVAYAHPMKTTFHRAFDRVVDQTAALEQLIDLGFTRLLTSGRPGNAIDHVGDICKLVDQARGRILVVAGGGIRLANIEMVALETRAPVLHMSCRVAEPDRNGVKLTDPEIVRAVMCLRRK